MHYSKLIVALLAGASLVVSTPYRQPEEGFSEDYLLHLRDVIIKEDIPSKHFRHLPKCKYDDHQKGEATTSSSFWRT
jgi:hypothetical protein